MQHKESLRRLGLKTKTRLPPDQPDVMDIMKPSAPVKGTSAPKAIPPSSFQASAVSSDIIVKGTESHVMRQLVAKDVARKEWMQNPHAKQAVQKEWDRLLDKKT